MVGDPSLVCLVLVTQVRAFVYDVFPSLTNPWHALSMVTRPSPSTALMHHRFHLWCLLQCATVFMVPPRALMTSFAVTLTSATPWFYWSWLYYTRHPWPWLLALALGYLDMDPKDYHLVRATSLASTLATTALFGCHYKPAYQPWYNIFLSQQISRTNQHKWLIDQPNTRDGSIDLHDYGDVSLSAYDFQLLLQCHHPRLFHRDYGGIILEYYKCVISLVE